MTWWLWAIVAGFAILAVDCAIGNYQEWRAQRKRARDIARFSMGPFKAVSRNWWEA